MPRVTLLQTNFTAGEISPRLVGRTDIDRYANAAAKLENAYPVIHGGAKRRGGTQYIKATKFAAKKSRLVPFVFSRDVAYMLEFGDLYVRVYKAGGIDLATEFVSPYTEAQVAEIDFVQGADTMFIAHPSVPIHRLQRLADNLWSLGPAPLLALPTDEQGHALAATATLSAATVGTGRTLTASAAVFNKSDVGRQFIAGAGVATITGYTNTTTLTADVTAAFSGTTFASGAWYLAGSPQMFLKVSAKGPVGTPVTLALASTRAARIIISSNTTLDATAAIFVAGDAGKTIYAVEGYIPISAFVSATQLSITLPVTIGPTNIDSGAWAITDEGWRAEDVGKIVRVSDGLVRITSFVSTNIVNGVIVTALSSGLLAPPGSWTLESASWSVLNGYPRSVTLHEQRLVAGGSAKYPQTVWGSRTGAYLDFTRGSADDDGYSFTLASDEINPISYLASLRNLVVHTYGGEFSMQGGVEKPITPTNVRIRQESAHGSRAVRPVLVGKESVFVQRAGRKVRSMGYSYGVDGYVAPDLSVLAEHITAGGVVQMAYQQEPDLVLWAVRGDGALLSCTFDRDQNVTAWAAHYTEGAFEGVQTIPNGDREETWVIVRRTVNGATVRYLELMNDTFAPALPGVVDPLAYPPVDQPTIYGYTVDCGLSFDNAAGQTTFSIPHLAGKVVDVVADGAVQPQATVAADGSLTIGRKSYRTLIGLHFRSEVALLTPEIGGPSGTAQGSSMRTSEVTLRFLDTIGASVIDGEGNAQEVPFRKFGAAVLDQAPKPFTGQVRIETLGWDLGRSDITIVQDQPLPMHLLAVIRKFQSND